MVTMTMTKTMTTTMTAQESMIIDTPNCSKRIMHIKCLTALGRTKPKCLTCEEIKVKVPYQPRGNGGGGGGGGGDPNPYDHDDGDGGPNWGRG
eukprot:896375-Amphidinium_carterae.1